MLIIFYNTFLHYMTTIFLLLILSEMATRRNGYRRRIDIFSPKRPAKSPAPKSSNRIIDII